MTQQENESRQFCENCRAMTKLTFQQFLEVSKGSKSIVDIEQQNLVRENQFLQSIIASKNKELEQLQAENERLKDSCQQYMSMSQRDSKTAVDIAYSMEILREENERLRGALEFYADEDNHGEIKEPGCRCGQCYIDAGDGGKIAREALAHNSAPAKEDKTNGGWLDIADVPTDTDILVRIKSNFEGSEAVVCQAYYEDGKPQIYNENSFGHFPLWPSRYVDGWKHINDKQKE